LIQFDKGRRTKAAFAFLEWYNVFVAEDEKTFLHKFWHDFIKKWLSLEGLVKELSGWGISRALILSCIFIGVYLVLAELVPNVLLFTASWAIALAPIWLPIGLGIGAWSAWIWYIQSLYLSGRDPILLEVRMPREVTKSPRAMEIALTYLSISSGETTWINRAWDGQVRPFFSLEIASFGGEIHFYIWCWRRYKETVEQAIYAQYPEVELVEVEDYASKFRYEPREHWVWGVEWPLMSYAGIGMGNFRINAYPPKSYIDFELEKDPKEEFKVDPLANVLEFMSAIAPNEQLWIQMVIRKCGKKVIMGFFNPDDEDIKWVEMVKGEVEQLRFKAALKPSGKYEDDFPTEDDKKHEASAFPHPTERQRYQLQTLERHLAKYPFEVGMRGIYWVRGEMRGPIFTGFRWIWKPFGNPNFMTHLRPRKWHCDYDYPWQDINSLRWINMGKRVHDAYRRRSFFHTPWILPTNILTNETLATLWHPPSRAVQTPGLQRIPATKAEPPPNLPR